VVQVRILLAASHRIISVEHPDEPFLWCIIESTRNEAISWNFETRHKNDSTEIPSMKLALYSGTFLRQGWNFSEFEIWPESQFFNLNSGNWDVKNTSERAFAGTRFEPLTDFQWNGKVSRFFIYSAWCMFLP
jgi:hypothetical protein